MKSTLHILLLLLLPMAIFAQIEQYSRVKVYLDGRPFHQLASLGLECEHGHHASGDTWESDLSEWEIRQLAEAGYRYEVQIADVSAFYAAQANDPARAPFMNDCGLDFTQYAVPQHFRLGSMGGYFTYQEMLQHLDSMAILYPNLVKARAPLSVVNLTHNGNQMPWVKISDNPNTDEAEPEVLYTALHHAREPAGLSQLIFYMWYLLENYNTDPNIQAILNNTELYFVPCMNPDGYIYNQTNNPNGGGMWRKNRRNNQDGSYGVDLNRNYGYEWGHDDNGSSPNPSSGTYRGPSAFSEPETQNIRDFCNAHNFKVTLNYHSWGDLLISPWGYNDTPTADSAYFYAFSDLLTRENHMAYGTSTETVAYNVNGTSDDWMFGEQVTKPKIYSFTPELGDNYYGFWPPSNRIIYLCRKTLWQNLAAAYIPHNYVLVEDITPPYVSGQPYTAQYSVRNYGTAATSASVTIPGGGQAPQAFNLAPLQADSGSFAVAQAGLQYGDLFQTNFLSTGNLFTCNVLSDHYYGTSTLPVNEGFNANLVHWTSPAAPIYWGQNAADFVSPPYCLKLTNLPNNGLYCVTYTPSVNLTGAMRATLEFQAKWKVQPNGSYVALELSSDGINYTPACGRYSRYTYDPATATPEWSGQQHDWVTERISLDNWVGGPLYFRFCLDGYYGIEGYYVDDLKIHVLPTNPVGVNAIATGTEGDIFPNPTDGMAYLPLPEAPWGSRFSILLSDVSGRVVLNGNVGTEGRRAMVDLTGFQPGVYGYRLMDADGMQVKSGQVVKF